MQKKVKTPWYKYYDGVKEHLEYPNFSVYKLIEFTSSKHLNNISYNYYGNKKTYYEFLKQIDEAARAFKAMGVKHKDIVSIIMPNTPEAIIAFYAINKIGAISNMIHPLSGENEIKNFLNTTSSKFIIVIDVAFEKINNIIKETKVKNIIMVSAADSMPPHMAIAYKTMNIYNNTITMLKRITSKNKEMMISWNDFIKKGKSYTKEIDDDFKGKDIAAILYSGGTSGEPKGVELTNLNLNALAMQSFEACANLKEKDKVLAIMPIFHGFGLGVCIHTMLSQGGRCILIPRFTAKSYAKQIIKYKCNFIAGVPTLFEALLRVPYMDGKDLSSLKGVFSGGDSLSIELKKKFDKFLYDHNASIQVREGYGTTETVTACCLTPPSMYKEGSIGIPFPDTYIKIVEPDTDNELPYGEEGEILLAGPTEMKCYWENQEETDMTLKKSEIDGLTWVHTGDLGYMDDEGFVYFKGRSKRMIITSGYNVYPAQLENVLDAHEDVQMSCVIGVPDPYKMQKVKAFVTLKPGITPNDQIKEDILAHCRKHLAKYAMPYDIEFRDDMPKTLVGKVAYRELEEEELAKIQQQQEQQENQ